MTRGTSDKCKQSVKVTSAVTDNDRTSLRKTFVSFSDKVRD